VPTTEFKGGHGYRLELSGAFVAEPRTGAPRWGLAVGDDQRFILEIRVALAWHPSATMVAAIRWEPGGEIRYSIGVRSNTWSDRELLLAGGALRFLTDRFCRGSAPPQTARGWPTGG
jgi:hypothetical protein